MKLLRLFAFVSCISLPFITFAQPANDDCVNAIVIADPSAFCSAFQAHTNVAATNSGGGAPACFTNTDNDVWFSFTAIATDVTVTIRGNMLAGSGGTLNTPEVAIYDGCGGTMLECGTDIPGNNVIQILENNLTVGQTYYIRVDGRNGATGTFQLCVDNYNAPPDPGSDCITGTILCNKDPFTVQSVIGAGNDVNEITSSCLNSEFASVWYKWTCDQPGTLTFTLTPNNNAPNGLADDLDFVVYELPNGVDNCNGKNELRCMASGQNVGSPLSNWIACTGATGLSSGANDVTEMAGCQNGDDNFVAELNMQAGVSYALIVMNFTNTGLGFSIDWGGTGTFLGPDANFFSDDNDNVVCVGESITFTDSSFYPGGTITNYTWNFGVDAIPQAITGIGPHTVSYTSPGLKSVALTVETDEGCTVTHIENVLVNPCCQTQNVLDVLAVGSDVNCANVPDGSITVTVNSAWAPYTFDWGSSGLVGANPNNLLAGTYTLTFTDAIGCDTIIDVTIGSPPPMLVATQIQQPTCSGGTDGGITLNVSGATPPYQYDFGTGFQNNNSLTNLSNGFYPVTIQDALGCDTSFVVEVWELVLELDTIQDFILEPSCYGFSNGSITASLANGLPPYQYDWGGGFQASNTLPNLSAGTYFLTVQDANLCQGTFVLEVTQPDSLSLTLNTSDVTCFGANDGEVEAVVTGGTPPYNYNWDVNQSSNVAIDLIAGNYALTVTDVQGCVISGSTTITQPDEVQITGISVTDVYCFGGSDGELEVFVSGGTPPFEYSIDGQNFQSSNILTGLSAGTYTVVVRDAFGCDFYRDATVNQPWEFWIRTDDDVTIDLGYSYDIDALVNTNPPVTYNWTPVEGLSCTDCEDPVASPVQTTTYVVEAIDSRGCIAYDSITINVDIKRPYFIPNAFTPNDDGSNDYFYVQGGVAIDNIRLIRIFDRWGGKVFETTNIAPNSETLGWDGTYNGRYVDPSVFVYYIELEFVDGVIIAENGDVTVLK